jgi:hypothetical protein
MRPEVNTSLCLRLLIYKVRNNSSIGVRRAKLSDIWKLLRIKVIWEGGREESRDGGRQREREGGREEVS